MPRLQGLAVVLLLTMLAAPVARATERESLPILATGDDVPTLGLVGSLSADLCGIDDRGRLLIATRLSDGSEELVRAEGNARTSLLRFGSKTRSITLQLGAWCASSPAGQVVLSGPVGSANSRDFLVYRVSPGGAEEVLRTGDVTREGFPISDWGIQAHAIGDDGTIAVNSPLIGTVGDYPSNIFAAMLAVTADGVRIVAADTHEVPVERRFAAVQPLAVTESGAIIFAGRHWTDDPGVAVQRGVFVGDGHTVHPLIVDGAIAPSGAVLTQVQGLAASPSGAVLVRGCRAVGDEGDPNRLVCDAYRFEEGQLSLVVAGDGRTPDGARLSIESGSLNDRGDVLLKHGWLEDDDPEANGADSYGFVLYPVDGSPRIIARDAAAGQLNQRVDVALKGFTGRPYSFARWRNGKLSELLSPGDRSRDGLPIVEGGFDRGSPGSKCLADDGRVGAFTAFVDDSRALLCTDAEGVHLVARDSDSAVQDLGFWRDLQCRFADDEMVFATNGAVFRARGEGVVELVLGHGVGEVNGQPIDRVGDLDAFWKTFAVNPRGTIAAMQYGYRLFRLPRGGPLEIIDLALGDSGDSVWTAHEIEIADDDSVIATATLSSNPSGSHQATTVVQLGNERPRVLVRQEDIGGSPVDLRVRGDLVQFATYDAGRFEQFVYNLRTSALERLAPTAAAAGIVPASVIDFTAAGDALFRGDLWQDDPIRPRSGRFLLERGTVSLVNDDATDSPRPVALNENGEILFEQEVGPRQALSRSGIAARGRCPGRLLAAVPRADGGSSGGCQIDRATIPSPWAPVLAIGALLVAAVRRVSFGDSSSMRRMRQRESVRVRRRR